MAVVSCCFFFSSRRRHTRCLSDWSSDVCSSDLTLLGLDKLLEAQLLVTPAEKRHDLEQVRNLVHSHTRRLARYRCENCGFKARQFYWHCPACGGWEPYPPRRTEEFDQT